MLSKGDITKVIEENDRRKKENSSVYNQITGEGSNLIPRQYICIPDFPETPEMYIPKEMVKNSDIYKAIIKYGSIERLLEEIGQKCTVEAIAEFAVLFLMDRCKYDFEFAAAWALVIKNKITNENTPFLFNRGQRKVIKTLEKMRLDGVPIRIILLKARQWGGSTVIQLYFFWLQVFVRKGLSSIIATHLQDASKNILAMYDLASRNIPEICGSCKLSPRMGMLNSKTIEGRNCNIAVGSAEKPDSLRSQSGSLAHFSEVAFFPSTQNNNPEKIVTSIVSMIPDAPYTVIALESTGNGLNYFYTEWKKAEDGESAYEAIFVSWFEIDNMYTMPIEDYSKFILSMNEYEWFLWEKGATLEGICWYRFKLKQQPSHMDMKQEFPSSPTEAFQTTGTPAFNREHLLSMESDCIAPSFVGDIVGDVNINEIKIKPLLASNVFDGIKFSPNEHGDFKIWVKPDKNNKVSNRYVVSVDTGGASKGADYSVISVIDRYWMMYGEPCEVVAEWRGHIDHDLLVWIAARIAYWYDKAMLVFESNTHESEQEEHSEFIFDTLARVYKNLYCRTPADKIIEGVPPKWGFHTNTSSKQMIIDNYRALIREHGYVERNIKAIHEAYLFEKRANGKGYGNIEGKGNHDDILMSRMIGLYVAYSMPMPSDISSVKIARHEVHSA